MKRKLKKVEGEKTYNQNKISKFIYFFFTLQNNGIPVNEIYEKKGDGVKFIKTDRFQEIMGQNGGGETGMEEKEKETEISFYSDDSYEYCTYSPRLEKISKFKNIRRIKLSKLNFNNLPEYTTTDDEEDEEVPMTPPHQVHPQSPKATAQPIPFGEVTPYMDEGNSGKNKHLQEAAKKPMNTKDYQESIKYIEKFYQNQNGG